MILLNVIIVEFLIIIALVIVVLALGSRASITHNPKKKKVIQIYLNDRKRVEKHTYHGLGDYLRGCIFLYNWCKSNGYELGIDFSRHSLSAHLECLTFSGSKSDDFPHCWDLNKIKKYMWEKLQKQDTVHVFSNGELNNEELSDDTKDFIKKHALTPNNNMQKLIERAKFELGLHIKQFIVMHVRLGDSFLVWRESNEIKPEIMKKLVSHMSEASKLGKVLVLSDSATFIKNVSSLELPNVFTTISYGTPAHIGHHSFTSLQMQLTLLDFFLMTESSRIDQFSVYNWASGFSDWCSRIYDVPLRIFKLY